MIYTSCLFFLWRGLISAAKLWNIVLKIFYEINNFNAEDYFLHRLVSFSSSRTKSLLDMLAILIGLDVTSHFKRDRTSVNVIIIINVRIIFDLCALYNDIM